MKTTTQWTPENPYLSQLIAKKLETDVSKTIKVQSVYGNLKQS